MWTSPVAMILLSCLNLIPIPSTFLDSGTQQQQNGDQTVNLRQPVSGYHKYNSLAIIRNTFLWNQPCTQHKLAACSGTCSLKQENLHSVMTPKYFVVRK